MTSTVVLVHGAFHGSGYWADVLDGLAACGIPALAPDLPGHGAHPGPALDVHGDAAAVRAVLDELTGPVVLVGHSYGGVVITEAGTHPAVAHLAYLAAYQVDETESTANAVAADAASIDFRGRPKLGTALTIADGVGEIDPERGAALFYSDCSPEMAGVGLASTGPQRLANLREAPAAVAWRDKPSLYAVCTQDQVVHPDLQRLMARRAGYTVEWDCGHFPMLSRPDLVVDLLAELADPLGD